jgi:hypothetical protein
MAVLWFDHEMGDRPSDRVHDHAAHLAAHPIGTAGFGPDRERCCLRHSHPPVSCGAVMMIIAFNVGRKTPCGTSPARGEDPAGRSIHE